MNACPSTLRESLKALPRAAWVLFFGTFLNKFGAFVVPFLTLYLTSRGYNLADIALAIAAYGIGTVVASVAGGFLADSVGRRQTIVLSMFSGAAALMLLSQARTLPVIVALTALAGLTNELYRPASGALLADLVPSGQRVTAFAAYRMAFNAGWAFGPAMAGFLAQRGYFWLFAGNALSSALFGALAFAALPKGARRPSEDCGWGLALKVIRADRKLQQVLLVSLAIGMVFMQMFSTFGLHVTHLGFSGSVYGMILSLNGALVVCCELALTRITTRFPARPVMALGYLLIGTGFCFNAAAHTIAALAACMVAFTFGEMTAIPVTSAYVADLAPAHMRGRYMGAYGLVWAGAMVLGPAAGMELWALGPMALWSSCGALAVVAALVLLVDV